MMQQDYYQPVSSHSQWEPFACLLPTGSALESIDGLSHLLEHYLIKTYYDKDSDINLMGFTNEDYIILFGKKFNAQNLIDTLREMTFTDEPVERTKMGLIKEINAESAKQEEHFFKEIWSGSMYQKSPLGRIPQVEKVSCNDLEVLRSQLMSRQIYIYFLSKGVEVCNSSINSGQNENAVSPPSPLPSPLPTTFTWRRNIRFGQRQYHIYYFNRDIESFYLISRVLQFYNPEKHIQLSEKKYMSALIIQNGTEFPGPDVALEKVFEDVFIQMDEEIISIQQNFKELAMNCLESIYFYGVSWEERIQRMKSVSPSQIAKLLNEIKAFLLAE